MKTKSFIIILISILLFGCNSKVPENRLNLHGEKILDRIKAPEGYDWTVEKTGSFGEYLQNLELEADGAEILDFQNKPIMNQYEHIAVIKKDIGNKDLQQCADAVIRLRADYLWENNRQDDIEFHFTNGDLYKWNDHKNGIRPILISNSKIDFRDTESFDDSYNAFRKYLDIVFTYAGTISLNKETTKVKKSIQTGDILVTPGSPGHALIIVGSAENKNGEKIYLLAQGYTPAQSIHIISNPYNDELNPWYKLDVTESPTITARYTFLNTNIRRFKD